MDMSTQPDWHDAPTCAGWWVERDADDARNFEIDMMHANVFEISASELSDFKPGSWRYYGPIAIDTKAPDAT